MLDVSSLSVLVLFDIFYADEDHLIKRRMSGGYYMRKKCEHGPDSRQARSASGLSGPDYTLSSVIMVLLNGWTKVAIYSC